MDLWYWFLLSMAMNVVMAVMCLHWNSAAQYEREVTDSIYELLKAWKKRTTEAMKAKDSLIQQCKYWAKKSRRAT